MAALLTADCGRSCPTYASPDEALKQATESPPDDCPERWASYVCSWSPKDHQRRRDQYEQVARTSAVGESTVIDEVYCGCLASAGDPCFVTLTRRQGASLVYTFVSTGGPGCKDAPLPAPAPPTVMPAECGTTLSIELVATKAP